MTIADEFVVLAGLVCIALWPQVSPGGAKLLPANWMEIVRLYMSMPTVLAMQLWV